MKKFYPFLIGAAALLGFTAQDSQGQTQQIATDLIGNSTATATSLLPTDVPDAHDNDLSTYAVLGAEASILLTPQKQSYIEVEFPEPVDANTPVYIVLSDDDPNGILRTLLGGTLGDLVNDLLDILLGSPNFTIDIKDGAGGPISSNTYTPGDDPEIYYGQDGLLYLKLVPTSAYQRVRVTVGNTGILGETSSLNFHGAFYLDGAEDECDPFRLTSIDVTGLTASILDDNPTPVTDPGAAIDDDLTTYSKLGYTSAVGAYVGSTIYQTIFFNSVSATDEEPIILMDFESSLLSLDLLDELTIEAWNGSTNVYTGSVSSLLTVEALYLLNLSIGSDIPVSINIPVTGSFDRVVISYTQTVSAGILSTPIRLYDVTKGPKPPVLVAYNAEACADAPITLEVDAPVTGNTYNWRSTDLTLLHTGTEYNYAYPADGESDTLLVEASNCSATSAFTAVILQGSESACLTSTITGFVDISAYTSANPLTAVATNGSNVVEYFDEIDGAGNYELTNVAKGSYNLLIVNEAASESDIFVSSVVDDGYVIESTEEPFQVTGLGEPVAIPAFVIMDAPLSYNDITISAIRQQQEILIRWAVQNQESFVTFEIEKSYDGKSFKAIGAVSSDKAETQNTYTFNDNDPTLSAIYYRIKGTEQNDKIKYSKITKVISISGSQFQLYPNPAKDQLHIANLKGDEQISILDISGRKIQTVPNKGLNTQINVQQLNQGNYFLLIQSQGKQSVLKFEKRNS
ncbi:MAG: T9SS type A sorting domain-containing protein [Taibaiella sp.]|nr:T9SS type A sorting domain-containing protein [Taibaiella sp.]